MNKPFRRFEILLPLQFNDGRDVPAELNALTLSELRNRFGAVSAETQSIQGEWSHQGTVYRDKLVRLFVDVPDEPSVVDFFARYKDVLKQRYQQIDIWMTTYPIEVV